MTHFELLEENILGEGSFGTVYQCRWYGFLATAKLVHVPISDETKEISQEIQMTKKLRCDYIAQFLGTAHHNDNFCLVTSYAEKGSLRQALEHHTLTNEQKPNIITGLIKGMLYLKKSNVIHRDLRSPNVLLDANCIPKISDFGLAQLKLNSATHAKISSSNVEITRWMAPELLEKRPRYSFTSDVYALGTVIWEILTEQVPYKDTSDIETIAVLISVGRQNVIPHGTQQHYKYIIKNCWHFDPEKRVSIEQIHLANDEALSWMDINSVIDNEQNLVYKARAIDLDSGSFLSNQQGASSPHVSAQDITKEADPTNYAKVLELYLQDTRNILDANGRRLEAILRIFGDSFTHWLRAAAKQGNNTAAIVLGEMYYSGCGVPQDYEAAFKQFENAAMVVICDQSDPGSLIPSTNLVEQWNAHYQRFLGDMHDFDQGVLKDSKKVIALYEEAFSQGNNNARLMLDRIYGMYDLLYGNRNTIWKSVDDHTLSTGSYNFDESLKKAKQGNIAAQCYLGWMYQRDKYVTKHSVKTVKCLCLGDSLTRGYVSKLDQHMFYDGSEDGDTVQEMYERLLKLPIFGTLILLGGTNDLGSDIEIDEIMRHFRRIYDFINKNEKITRFTHLTVPFNAFDKFESERINKEELNNRIKHGLTSGKRKVLDINESFNHLSMDENERELYWSDSIHYSDLGYGRVAELITRSLF